MKGEPDLERIEGALAAAHRRQSSPAAPPGWETRLLAAVRQQQPAPSDRWLLAVASVTAAAAVLLYGLAFPATFAADLLGEYVLADPLTICIGQPFAYEP